MPHPQRTRRVTGKMAPCRASVFVEVFAFEVQRPPHASEVREPAGDHADEAQELVVLAHDHRAVGRCSAGDQVGHIEERFVERLYLRVGRRLELSPTDRSRTTPVGGTVELGQAVEDINYEVGETKSSRAVRERVPEVDVRVLAGGFSVVLRGTKITVPPWRASRSTLTTRIIMRLATLCGSVASSGAHAANRKDTLENAFSGSASSPIPTRSQ